MGNASLPTWQHAITGALLVFASFGVVLLGGQLLVTQLRNRPGDELAFGPHTLHGAALVALLGVTIVLLVAVAAGALYATWAAILGLVVGAAGTVFSTIGLAHGGAAGPAPAAYWWLLTAISVATVLVRTLSG